MTVYVDYTPPGGDLAWSRLWADTAGEAAQFAARLGVSCPVGQAGTTIPERLRRRAIVMGAIPVHRFRRKAVT